MPIDFFLDRCKSESRGNQFGLCDDPPPAEYPAYIDEVDTSIWIAEIKNAGEVNVEFFAIDHCVDVYRLNNEKAKRCDGILRYESKLIFVELKDRGHTGWISTARKQLTETLHFVKANHDLNSYTDVNASICNKQRPLAITGNNIEVQKFKDDTGLLLTIDRTVIVQ